MKNIHVLPTDKPSRLHFDSKLFVSPKYQLSSSINSIVKGRNFYITNDEKIKEGDWVFNEISKEVYKITNVDELVIYEKRVILTTDQELIKDGVQAIDDEFLEWFVKNPSCENVEIINRYSDFTRTKFLDYKIIIPQEEPKDFLDRTETDLLKQEAIEQEMEEFDKQETLEEYATRCDEYSSQLEKETLEEASKKYQEINCGAYSMGLDDAFEEGAKWQVERMYSEEEVLILLNTFSNRVGIIEDEQKTLKWFEQNKKK